jgi:hypothetical protein
MKKFLLFCTGILSMRSLHANVIFPFMTMDEHINAVLPPYYLISFLVVLESFIFIIMIPHQPRLKIILATLAMNFFSAIIGIISMLDRLPSSALNTGVIVLTNIVFFIPLVIFGIGQLLGDLLFELLKLLIGSPQQSVFFSLLYILCFTVFTGVANTLIEYPVAWLFFRNEPQRRLLLAIYIINTASALAGAIAVAIVYGIR